MHEDLVEGERTPFLHCQASIAVESFHRGFHQRSIVNRQDLAGLYQVGIVFRLERPGKPFDLAFDVKPRRVVLGVSQKQSNICKMPLSLRQRTSRLAFLPSVSTPQTKQAARRWTVLIGIVATIDPTLVLTAAKTVS